MKAFCILLLSLCSVSLAQAQHEHSADVAPQIRAPRIFLDKSPRVVAYQLGRLSNEQLLLVETKVDDPKYLPVFNAILTREGMSRGYRDDALQGMITINGTDAVSELAVAMKSVAKEAASERTITTLAAMLMAQPAETLSRATELLVELATDENQLLSSVGYGGLLASGEQDRAWELADEHQQLINLLDSIALVPSTAVRNALHSKALELTESEQPGLQKAAIRALAAIPASQNETFLRVAKLIENDALRADAVKTLLAVPAAARDAELGQELVAWLVAFAERTPAEQRTEDAFLDAMELVEQLLARAPTDFAKTFRQRLRETVVRVIRIHTVEEEMRYDTAYFAVEAGRPVQIVLINEDLMPHNLVITSPGTLKQVAEEGLAVGPTGGLDGKQYVPHSDHVLFATDMVPTLEQERLTFDAPAEPGEYPYVCTFPRHWMRMYGVMVVVEDLDAWLANPTVPKDPIGSNRQFIQSWTVDDLKGDLDLGLRGRSPQIGERIFTEATCAQCHKVGGIGIGNVGPELSQTFAKYKGDNAAVLQEILDPSHRIDDKYAVHLVLDIDGQTFSGLVVAEDKEKVSLLENPEAKEPKEILKDDIERMVKTSTSMMPKGLMDRFSKDEIFELVSFIKNLQQSEK